MEILENIILSILNTSLLEWFAVLTGLIYIILVSAKKIHAWFFALLSSTLYVYLCYQNRLYLESGLQFFYIIMGVYGWSVWRKHKAEEAQDIIKWDLSSHLINIGTSAILTLLIGFIFDKFTNHANPYADAFISIFSLTATYMVTKKVLENWIYWILIDASSIYLYSSRELYLTSILYFLFTCLAIFGYFKWRKLFKHQTQ